MDEPTSHADATPGDVNGNGVIDIVDRALLLNHILMRTPLEGEPLASADANQDNKVGVADLVCQASMFTYSIIEMMRTRLREPV